MIFVSKRSLAARAAGTTGRRSAGIIAINLSRYPAKAGNSINRASAVWWSACVSGARRAISPTMRVPMSINSRGE